MEPTELFNLSELEVLATGDVSFIIKMLDTFSLTVPPFIERMKVAVASKDLAELAKVAHRLKPSFHYLGRPDLSSYLAEAENGDGRRDEKTILEATKKFLTGVAPMMVAVDEHLEKLKQA